MRQAVARILILMAVTPFTFAADIIPPQLVLDKIVFQISAKQWVTTQSALLGVSINVTLNGADMVKARADIMDRLNKIAKGSWNLTEFERSQDSSGLEKLYVQAQARVDQTALTDIYKNAKAVSMPGAKYEISSVEFKPSFDETQTVLAKVREQLYQQVNDEIARMNKAYPAQNYSVSNMMFISGDNSSQPRPYQAKEMNTVFAAAAQAPQPSVSVSNELVLTAVVEAASNRKQSNQGN